MIEDKIKERLVDKIISRLNKTRLCGEIICSESIQEGGWEGIKVSLKYNGMVFFTFLDTTAFNKEDIDLLGYYVNSIIQVFKKEILKANKLNYPDCMRACFRNISEENDFPHYILYVPDYPVDYTLDKLELSRQETEVRAIKEFLRRLE